MDKLFRILEQFLCNLETLDLKLLPELPEERYDIETYLPVRDDWASSITLRFHSVKTLVLTDCTAWPGLNLRRLRILLTLLPNLKSIIVKSEVTKEILSSPFSELITSDLREQLTKLQSIDFVLEVDNERLVILKRKGLLLKHLNLKLRRRTSARNLKEFLTTISGTLQTLHIQFDPGFFSGSKVTFPSSMTVWEAASYMQNVEELRLDNFAGPIDFSRLAKLKSLCLNGKSSREHYRNMKIPAGLNTFKTDTVMESQVISSVVNSLPSLLTSIKLPGICDSDLDIIYRNLPVLKELEIVNGNVLDEGLTGVLQDRCETLLETREFMTAEALQFRSELYIGSLPHLTSLRLINCNLISDISIFFGIIECRKLETLVLNCNKLTDISLMRLVDVLSSDNDQLKQLSHLDVHECSNIASNGKIYMRDKLVERGIRLGTLVLDDDDKNTKVENAWRQVGRSHPSLTGKLE